VADDPYLHPPKLPRAPVRDGKLYVEGEKEPYFREPQHTIQLRVHSLTVRRGYQPEDWQNPTSKKKALKETLHGLAENNEFNVIGLDKVYSPSTSIEFLLASVPDTEREFYWHTTIGFHACQYEGPGEPHWPRGFWVHGYCPSQYLDDLLAAVRRDHVDNILVEMQTTMWTRNSGTYSSGPWHLARPTDRSSEPSKEHGYRFGIGPDGFGPRDWFREAQAEAYGAAYLKTDAGKKNSPRVRPSAGKQLRIQPAGERTGVHLVTILGGKIRPTAEGGAPIPSLSRNRA
jgi:hypothetical protein